MRVIPLAADSGDDTPEPVRRLRFSPDGRRLAKRHGDTRLSVLRAAGVPAEKLLGLLAELLLLLGLLGLLLLLLGLLPPP